MDDHDRIMAGYLKPDLLIPDLKIIDDFGMKQLPKRSGEFLFEIVMRRYEKRSTMMTTNRPPAKAIACTAGQQIQNQPKRPPAPMPKNKVGSPTRIKTTFPGWF